VFIDAEVVLDLCRPVAGASRGIGGIGGSANGEVGSGRGVCSEAAAGGDVGIGNGRTPKDSEEGIGPSEGGGDGVDGTDAEGVIEAKGEALDEEPEVVFWSGSQEGWDGVVVGEGAKNECRGASSELRPENGDIGAMPSSSNSLTGGRILWIRSNSRISCCWRASNARLSGFWRSRSVDGATL